MNKFITSLFAVCLGLNVLSQAALSARDDNAFCYNDSCSSGFSVNVEWLYLRPCSDGLQFGFVEDESVEVIKRTSKHLDPDLASGFRLGIGYRETECCNWDINLNWFHHCSEDTKKFLNPRFIGSGANPIGKAKLRHEFDEVFLELGYKFCVGECFALRPHTAIRYINVCRKISQESLKDEEDEFYAKTTINRDFDGVGPQFGLDAEWDFYCGIGIYGDVAISLIYGDTDSKRTDIDNNNAPPLNIIKEGFHCSIAVADCGVGLFYRSEYCDYPFSLVLGWEHHHYFDFSTKAEENFVSDVSLQGLRLGFNAGF